MPVSAPGLSPVSFAPYSTFLVPPPVYAKEGYGGGISMDGFKHMLLGEAPEASTVVPRRGAHPAADEYHQHEYSF